MEMLTLYYGPGACSMASHIALEEAGAEYEPHPVLLSKGEQKSEAYLRVNPRARVPALRVDDQILTENLAILTYVAKRFPEAKLLPADLLDEARCLSVMAFFASTVHTTFAHVMRPERYSRDAAAQAVIKDTGRETFLGYLREIDAMLAGKSWVMGEQYTVADPYALVFYWWGSWIELPVQELKSYTAHKDRMLQRPAVRRTLEQERIPLK
jgi:glutathione S-transferase